MSSRPCQVCSHPSRLAIDQALLNGKGLRVIARDFGIGSGEYGTDTFKADHKKVDRHRHTCMGESYRAAKDAELVGAGKALIDRMATLNEAVMEVLERSRAGVPVTDEHGVVLLPSGEPVLVYPERVILGAVAEARRNVETEAKLAGALPEGDEDAATKARAALANPAVRKALADVDAAMAGLDT